MAVAVCGAPGSRLLPAMLALVSVAAHSKVPDQEVFVSGKSVVYVVELVIPDGSHLTWTFSLQLASHSLGFVLKRRRSSCSVLGDQFQPLVRPIIEIGMARVKWLESECVSRRNGWVLASESTVFTVNTTVSNLWSL